MTKKNDAALKKEAKGSMRELDLAWEEFFKDKPEPKNEEEERKEQEEFLNWYNNVRKQSDTGKTPKEMGERMLNSRFDDEETERLPRPFMECLSMDGLEVQADLNKYTYIDCGSVCQRLKPLNDGIL